MGMTVFWDVDTQRDFMNEDGALYVSGDGGAEKIKPYLRALMHYARAHGVKIIHSADAHDETDPEMSANGGPFPFHCMKGMPGQKHIRETEPHNAVVVENREYASGELKRIIGHGGEIVIEKQHYDVFTNPNTEKIVEGLGVTRAVVYGVATDYCDRAAALGLRERGVDVYLVTDAIKPVDSAGGQETLQELFGAGVRPITTKEVLEGLYEEVKQTA